MRTLPAFVLMAQVVLVSSATAQLAKKQGTDIHGDLLPQAAIARLGTSRFQLETHVSDIALSPDGTTVVAADSGKHIDFMEVSTGKCIRKLGLVDHGWAALQFTPDGKSLMISNSSHITLLEAATGKVSRSIDITDFALNEMVFATNGHWLAAQLPEFAFDARIKIWELKTGKEVALLPGRGADAKALTIGPEAKRLLLWSTVPTLAGKESDVFWTESKAALVCIDVGQKKIVGETTLGNAQYAALSPDGETVAFEAADHQSVRIRHLPTATERCVVPVQQSKFAFAPDGKVIVTFDQDGKGALWITSTGDKIRDLEGGLANKDYRIIGVSRDGKTLAVLDGGWQSVGMVAVWNAATGKRMVRPAGHEGAITCMAYLPGGKLLASGSQDKTIRLWNAVTGEHLRILTTHKDKVTAIAIAADGKLLASSCLSGITRLFNVGDGKIVAEFDGPAKGARALAFSADGKKLLAVGGSPEVLAWEIASGKEVVRLKTGADGAVMAFADGGALALTANGQIRAEKTLACLQIWNPTSELPKASLPLTDTARGRVHCDAAIFSPQNRMLASSQVSEYQDLRPFYGAAMLRLWERASGQPIRTLAPTITQLLAFSGNGRLLASGGTGSPGHLQPGHGPGVDIWDALTGKKIRSLDVSPLCLAFSPDGRHLATGGRDHCILIWEAPKIDPPKEDRPFTAAEREALWNALGGDAERAYAAMAHMLGVPGDAVALLKERIRPEEAGDPETVARLIMQLDSKKYGERLKAESALEKIGEGAAHHLTKALEGGPTLELRRRLEDLLKKCEATSSRNLRHHRAVATLEWIATPEACALLRTLAGGVPGARLTIEAQAALKRL